MYTYTDTTTHNPHTLHTLIHHTPTEHTLHIYTFTTCTRRTHITCIHETTQKHTHCLYTHIHSPHTTHSHTYLPHTPHTKCKHIHYTHTQHNYTHSPHTPRQHTLITYTPTTYTHDTPTTRTHTPQHTWRYTLASRLPDSPRATPLPSLESQAGGNGGAFLLSGPCCSGPLSWGQRWCCSGGRAGSPWVSVHPQACLLCAAPSCFVQRALHRARPCSNERRELC